MFSFSRRALLLVAVVPALLLTACGEDEKPDPYVYGNLDQVTRGFVESEEFLFEIPASDLEVVFAMGNTAIVRRPGDDVNRLEILVADDAENRIATWDDELIGVQKFYSPYVWLMAKRVKEQVSEEEFNIVELDSVPDPVLPKFANVDLEEVSGFDLGTLRYNRKQQIDDMAEAEVQGVGVVVQLPDHQAEEVEQPEDADPAEVPEPQMAWYLQAQGSDATFKITNVTPELELAFRILEAEDLPFIGGVKIGEAYTWAERRESRVSCPVEVTFVRYANRYLAP